MRKNNVGATAIEVAIVLPLFLILLTTALDVAMLAYTRITARTAIVNAARLGITRGDRNLTGGGLINSIDQLAQDYDDGIAPHQESTLFTHNSDQNTLAAVDEYLGGSAAQPNLQRLYALALMNESIRLAMGGLVKFPCSGPGCMSCTSEMGSNVTVLLHCTIEPRSLLPSLLDIWDSSQQSRLRRIEVSALVSLPERH